MQRLHLCLCSPRGWCQGRPLAPALPTLTRLMATILSLPKTQSQLRLSLATVRNPAHHRGFHRPHTHMRHGGEPQFSPSCVYSDGANVRQSALKLNSAAKPQLRSACKKVCFASITSKHTSSRREAVIQQVQRRVPFAAMTHAIRMMVMIKKGATSGVRDHSSFPSDLEIEASRLQAKTKVAEGRTISCAVLRAAASTCTSFEVGRGPHQGERASKAPKSLG